MMDKEMYAYASPAAWNQNKSYFVDVLKKLKNISICRRVLGEVAATDKTID